MTKNVCVIIHLEHKRKRNRLEFDVFVEIMSDFGAILKMTKNWSSHFYNEYVIFDRNHLETVYKSIISIKI